MEQLLFEFVLIVGIGAIIGWFTNFLAVKLLFRPIKCINIFGIKIQGLIPKRRNELIESISKIVEDEFISISDITTSLKDIDLETEFDEIVNRVIGDNFKEKVSKVFPMAGFFIGDKVISKLKKYLKEIIIENKDEIVEILLTKLETSVNIREIISEKIADYPIEKLEQIILAVSKKELFYIEVLGGVLGAFIGLAQFILLHLIR